MGRRSQSHHSMDGLLGLPVKESRRAMRKPRSLVASWLIRFGVLYTLYMILVGCPAALHQDDPAVCHRYYELKRVAVKHVAPHVQPYYDQYAFPYITKGEPYYRQANELLKQADAYARPVAHKTHRLYADNLQPHVDRTYTAGKTVFDDKVGRHVYKTYDDLDYQVRRAWYQYAGRHVDAAGQHYNKLVAPYVDTATVKAQQVWDKALVPSYHKARPHAVAAAQHGAKHYHAHVHPQVLRLWRAIKHFIDTRIMPTIRRYYYLYIDPQVSRITDKIFQFQAQRGFSDQVTVGSDALSASLSASVLESILSTTTLAAKTTVIAGETISEAVPEPTVDAATERQIETEVIEQLVAQAKAGIRAEADAALAALEEQLDEILPQLVRKEEMICQDYLLQLESITVAEVDGVEKRILSLAAHLTNKGKDLDELADELRPYFVRAGKAIHREAVEVKAHLATVMDSLDARVGRSTAAVYRGLSEHAARLRAEPEERIKFGSAASSGSWSRELAALDRLSSDVDRELRNLAQSKVSAYSVALQSLLRETEANVEKLAGGAASKLQTLHGVGPRKVQLNDVSREFGHGYKPVAAMLGAQALYEQVSAAIAGSDTKTEQAVPIASQIIEGAADAVRHATDAVVDALDASSVAAAAAGAASVVADKAADAAAVISEKVGDIDRDEVIATLSSAASVATARAAAAYAQASNYVDGIDTAALRSQADDAASVVSENAGIAASAAAAAAAVASERGEAAISAASERGEAAISAASEAINGPPPTVPEKVFDKLSKMVQPNQPGMTDRIAEAVQEAVAHLETEAARAAATATAAAAGAAGYAADFGNNLDAQARGAGNRVKEVVVERANAAASVVKDTVNNNGVGSDGVAGVAESVVARASEAILGKEQNVVESALSRATEAASQAAAAVSDAVVGQQQGTVDSVVSRGSALAADAVAHASEVVIGKEQGVVESALSRAAEAASTAAAQASDAIIGKEQGVVESALSRAADAAAHATQAAASVVEDIKDAAGSVADVGAQTEAVQEAISRATDGVKSAAQGVVDGARQHIDL